MFKGSIDDLILREIDRAGVRCITSIEIENALRAVHGDTTHQSVTGNLRHLVERGEVYRIDETRMVEGAERQVYVSPKHYSESEHGERLIVGRKARTAVTADERQEMRDKILNAKEDSSHQRMMELYPEKDDGFTCHEVESDLNMSHQTASARLSEQHKAGFIRKTGDKRQGPNDKKPQPIYELTPDGLAVTSKLAKV